MRVGLDGDLCSMELDVAMPQLTLPGVCNIELNRSSRVSNDDVTDLVAGPFALRTSFIVQRVTSGDWRESCIGASEAGLTRDLPIFLADRKSEPIVHDWHGDKNTFCPPVYWDLAIGSGPCGLGCRGCYLLGTFRGMRDPHQPLVYENVAFFWNAVRRWLVSPCRRACHTLGLGTDRSDSLLFENVTRHARHLIPMFADPVRNPLGCKLFLLTKSQNVRFLTGLPTRNVIVSFSLNPQDIADLWEGRWPDTLERIPPSIDQRLDASRRAQRMGFEVRWRIDPILTPPGWNAKYLSFFRESAARGNRPIRITLGTFRETRASLDYWRRHWNLPAMEWRPETLRRDGTHRHAPVAYRVQTYQAIAAMCAEFFPDSVVALCKETKEVRRLSCLNSASCNCLA